MFANEQYSAKNICEILKISRSTINLWVDTRNFPQPVKIGTRCNRWNASQVDQWIEENLNTKIVRA